MLHWAGSLTSMTSKKRASAAFFIAWNAVFASAREASNSGLVGSLVAASRAWLRLTSSNRTARAHRPRWSTVGSGSRIPVAPGRVLDQGADQCRRRIGHFARGDQQAQRGAVVGLLVQQFDRG